MPAFVELPHLRLRLLFFFFVCLFVCCFCCCCCCCCCFLFWGRLDNHHGWLGVKKQVTCFGGRFHCMFWVFKFSACSRVLNTLACINFNLTGDKETVKTGTSVWSSSVNVILFLSFFYLRKKKLPGQCCAWWRWPVLQQCFSVHSDLTPCRTVASSL